LKGAAVGDRFPGINFTQPTLKMFWADIILLFSGLAVIAMGLFLSQRLGNKNIELGFDKLGLDLKGDRLTFILMIGLVLIGVGVFFRYQNYENELNKLKIQVEGFKPVQEQYNKNLEALNDQLKQFKVYDLYLKISFPDVQGAEIEKYFKIDVYTKTGDDVFQLSNFKPITSFGETYVKLTNLNRGQRVRISARDTRNDTTWESVSDILIPEAEIQMRKSQ